MCGTDRRTGHLCSRVNPKVMVTQDHLMRAIRQLVNAVPKRLPPAFDGIVSLIWQPVNTLC